MASDPTYTGISTIEDVLNAPSSCSAAISSIQHINNQPACSNAIATVEEIVASGEDTDDAYHQPSGKHICELDHADALATNDLLLISQKQSNQNAWSSKKLDFGMLKTQLLADLKSALKVGSMAYEDKSDWALNTHNHNTVYNLVEWHPNPEYTPPSTSQAANDLTCLARIHLSTDVQDSSGSYHIDEKHLSVNCPITLASSPSPLVGTLRFVASPTIQKLVDANMLDIRDGEVNVNPYDTNHNLRDDFDGWVFLNGCQFHNYNHQLSDAAFVFAGSYDAATFTVPTLTSFFQAVGNDAMTYSIAEQPQQIGLAKHQHQIGEMEINCDLVVNTNKTKIISTHGFDGGAFIHWGQINSTSTQTIQSVHGGVSFDGAKLNGLKTSSAGTGSKAYQPACNLVPVMMYIGGKA